MIFRDRWGIPHLQATSVTQLAFEQGWVTAHERADQLRLEHHRGTATTVQLVGEAGAEWDDFARRAELASIAKRAFDALPDDDRAFVAAYADGVRAAGRVPGWEDWSSLAIFAVQHILFASFPGKLWRQHALETIGSLSRDFELEGRPQGSNAFAVGAGRTRLGAALVAGDPHRVFEQPGVYQQVRLAAEDFDVAGFTFPGVPGVQHFAHAGSVAWGITNAVADYQDLTFAQPHDSSNDSANDSANDSSNDSSNSDPRIIDEPAISLRTPAWLLGDLGFAALLPLLRARTADDAVAAFDHWVEPVNNLLVADTTGAVRHVVVGKVPQRRMAARTGVCSEDPGWRGWVELPRREARDDALFVSANDRAWNDFERIGSDFSPPFRAQRIRTLLDNEPVGGLDATAAARVLCDVRQMAGASLLMAIAAASELSSKAQQLRDDLLDWDREMRPDSELAARFKDVRDEIVLTLVASPQLDAVRALPPHASFYAPWFDLTTRMQDSLHRLILRPIIFGLNRADVIASALETVAERAPQKWAQRHVFTALSGREQFGLPDERERPEAAVALPGDSQCVFATGSVPGATASYRGPVARYAWDLAGWEHSGWVTPLGAQHDLWAAGDFVPLVRDWAALEPHPHNLPEEPS